MASFARGTVIELEGVRRDMVRLRVALPEGPAEAVGFETMLGPVAIGDRVVVNTTGVELGLGTGGVAFVLWNEDGPGPPGPGPGPGHIVKLRYTPWQRNVVAVEEEGSPHHGALAAATTLEGMPVVACGLHSQVAGVAAGIRAQAPGARVGYLMTDGGALPLAWSDLVADLEEAGLIDVTCTCGHAFGGDLEAVNEHSGMVALRRVGGVDTVVAALGPGVVGTGTALGFSGLEQGRLLDACAALGGRPVACVRLSFADARARHRGVSHHSATALSLAARERCTVVVPALPEEQSERVREQLVSAGVAARHDVVIEDGSPALELLAARGLHPRSMGRSVDDDPAPWLAAGAAGRAAARLRVGP